MAISRDDITEYLQACEGPSILYGQSDDIVLAYTCGPEATFASPEGQTEFNEHGRAIPKVPFNESQYAEFCEPSGNGIWHHPGTNLFGHTPSEACRVMIVEARLQKRARAGVRQREHQLRRTTKAAKARRQRSVLNDCPPLEQEVVDETPALQYAVQRIRKKLREGKLRRKDITREDVFEFVDEFYALPALTTVDDALDLADEIDDQEAVESLLEPTAITGKRKRASMEEVPLGSIARGAVVLPHEPVVPDRSLFACFTRKPQAKWACEPAHRDMPAGPPAFRPVAGNSRTRTQDKHVHFPSAIAVERNGSIWPFQLTNTTDNPARDPSQLAIEVRKLTPELFEYLLHLINMRIEGEEPAAEDDEDTPPKKRTRAGTPVPRRNGESSNSHDDDDDDDDE